MQKTLSISTMLAGACLANSATIVTFDNTTAAWATDSLGISGGVPNTALSAAGVAFSTTLHDDADLEVHLPNSHERIRANISWTSRMFWRGSPRTNSPSPRTNSPSPRSAPGQPPVSPRLQAPSAPCAVGAFYPPPSKKLPRRSRAFLLSAFRNGAIQKP